MLSLKFKTLRRLWSCHWVVLALFFVLPLNVIAPKSANAQPRPDYGNIYLELNPGATIEMFPRVNSRRVEMVISEQRDPIHQYINGVSSYFLLDIDGYSTGGGVWLLSLTLDRDNLDVTIEQDGDAWMIEIVPGGPEVIELGEIMSAIELLEPGLARTPGPIPATPLHPLTGDAVTIGIEPDRYKLYIPDWEPEIPSRQPDYDLLRLSEEPTLEVIDRYRRVATESPLRSSRDLAYYRMGKAYFDMGLPRESLFYFNLLAESDGEWDPEVVNLYRAQAALQMRRWEEARERCEDAMLAGAREERVIECLAVVSLATSSPPPAQTGRALAATTGRPEALMLAGQLLQLDNAHREAEPLIRLAASNLEGDMRKQALISLGDALYAHGDLTGARDAWRYVGSDGALGAVLLQRQRMLTLVERGPREWANAIPDLMITAARRDRSGAEAGYLLAQIAEALGDTRGAADSLMDLMTRHHSIVEGSDVPDRLWRIMDRRLGLLQRQGRSLEQVAFYNDFYSTRLRSKVVDTEQLVGVAAACEALGLYSQALSVQREVFAIHSAQQRDDLDALTNLVRLYVKNDRPLEALETVEYIQQRPSIQDNPSLLGLYEGRSYEELGRLGEAREAYARGATSPSTRLESIGRLSLLEAADENCPAAIEGLEALVEALPGQAPEQLMDGRAHIALARCFLLDDRPEDALVVASAAVDRSADSLHERYATYLAALAAQRSGGEDIYQEVLESYDDIWSALGAETMMDAQFQAEYAGRLAE